MRTGFLGPVDAERSRDATAAIWDGVKACVAEAEAAKRGEG